MKNNSNPPIYSDERLPQRVAVLRALQLGDLLCAVPAFRALRRALPGSRIVLVGLPWARDFVERFAEYFDELLVLPGYPGLPEVPVQVERLPGFLAIAQQERFDLAIQMHGSGGIVNPLAVLLGAKRTAGFFTPGEYCPDPERFLAYPQAEAEVRRHLKLMQFLGVPEQGEALEFPLHSGEREAAAALIAQHGLQSGYACVHPGARAADRRWPPEYFARVADDLMAQGLPVVLTGSAEEQGLTAAVAAHMQAKAVDLAGQTSLGTLAGVIVASRLLVCNDTGVSHLAAALKVPSVVIFSRSERERWAPLDVGRHRCLGPVPAASPQAVIGAVRSLFERGADHAA